METKFLIGVVIFLTLAVTLLGIINYIQTKSIKSLKKFKIEYDKNRWLTKALHQEKMISIEDLNCMVNIPKHQINNENKERIRQEMAFELGTAIATKYNLQIKEIKSDDPRIARYHSKVSFIIP